MLDNDCPGVADITNEKVSPVCHHANTCGATVAHICAHIAHFVVGLFKAFYEQKSNKADQRPGAALFLQLAKNVDGWHFTTKTLLKGAGRNFGAKGKK